MSTPVVLRERSWGVGSCFLLIPSDHGVTGDVLCWMLVGVRMVEVVVSEVRLFTALTSLGVYIDGR